MSERRRKKPTERESERWHERKIFAIQSTIQSDIPIKICLKLCKPLIVPIAVYGSEMWGSLTRSDCTHCMLNFAQEKPIYRVELRKSSPKFDIVAAFESERPTLIPLQNVKKARKKTSASVL